MSLNDMRQDYLIRLRFIESMLVLTNNCTRQDISDMFEVEGACATRDIKRYKELNPGIDYCYQRRAYCKTVAFKRVEGLVPEGNHAKFMTGLSIITGKKAPL